MTQPEKLSSWEEEARRLQIQASSLHDQGQFIEALERLYEVESICVAIGGHAALVGCLERQATNLHALGRNEEAIQVLEKVRTVCRVIEDWRGQIRSLENQVLILRQQLGWPTRTATLGTALNTGKPESSVGPPGKKSVGPVTVFLSYCRPDEGHKGELLKHLKTHERTGLLRVWHDREICPGDEWNRELMEKLKTSQIVVLLISPDFCNSEFCWTTEMSEAMKRHDDGHAVVIPVVVRTCDWTDAPFAKLQMLPKDGKPVKGWSDQDEAWTDVANGIKRAVEQLGSAALVR